MEGGCEDVVAPSSIDEPKPAYRTSARQQAHLSGQGKEALISALISIVFVHLRDCMEGYIRPIHLQPLLERSHG